MSHNYLRLYYHFVWATWNRMPLLTGEVEERAYALIRQQATTQQGELIAIGSVEDHVHLLVSVPPTVALSDFIKIVKGVSSLALNAAFARPAWNFK